MALNNRLVKYSSLRNRIKHIIKHIEVVRINSEPPYFSKLDESELIKMYDDYMSERNKLAV